MCGWHSQVQSSRKLSEHSGILQVQVQAWFPWQRLWLLRWETTLCLPFENCFTRVKCLKFNCLSDFYNDCCTKQWHISFHLKLDQKIFLKSLSSCYTVTNFICTFKTSENMSPSQDQLPVFRPLCARQMLVREERAQLKQHLCKYLQM